MIANREECIQPDELTDLLAGRLPAHRFVGALEHVDHCHHCAAAVEAHSLADGLDWVRLSPAVQPWYSGEPECQATIAQLLLKPNRRAQADPLGALPIESLGPYRLLKWLGSGGMGAVYLAEHQRLKRLAAIKLLPRDRLVDSGWLDRFNREMTSIAALEHAHVVRAIDAGEQAGWHYLVMEYLDGSDLGQLSRAMGPLPVRTACELMRQAALGLSAIHELDMTHRDVKPSNLYLTRQGVVKLLDLGLVLSGESPLAADERLTTVGHLMGTLPYMAREQLLDASSVDWRADIYSLGATLCRLITGRAPFGSADNLALAIQAISTRDCPPMLSIAPDMPRQLAGFIDTMLHHDRQLRPQSAREVAEQLAEFADPHAPQPLIRTALQRLEQSSTTNQLPTPPSAVAPVPLNSTTGQPPARWSLWIAAALLPLAFLAGIVITVATDQGTLVIESEEPGVTIQVTQDEKVVEQLQIENRQGVLRLASGKYRVELTGVQGDGLTLSDSRVAITRGQKELLRIHRQVDSNVPSPASNVSKAEASRAGSGQPHGSFYQGKTLAEWMDVLEREKDVGLMAEAMHALSLLAETDGERLAAAKKMLLPARRLGGYIMTGRATNGNIDYSGWYMFELMNRYANFLPTPGLQAIVEELETGNSRSAQACVAILSHYADRLSLQSFGHSVDVKLFEHLAALADQPIGQAELTRLDKALEKSADQLEPIPQQLAMRVRAGLLELLGHDLSEQPQLVNWAKQQLQLANQQLHAKESETSGGPGMGGGAGSGTGFVRNPLAPETAIIVSQTLKDDYSLPLLLGLLERTAGSWWQEREVKLTAALQRRVSRHPNEVAHAVVVHLERLAKVPGPGGFPGMGGGLPLVASPERVQLAYDLLLTHDDNPLATADWLLSLVKNPNDACIFTKSNMEDLLRRVALRLEREAHAKQDPLADKKDIVALTLWAAWGLPSESIQECIDLVVARDRPVEKSRLYVGSGAVPSINWLQGYLENREGSEFNHQKVSENAIGDLLPYLVSRYPEPFIEAYNRRLQASSTLQSLQIQLLDRLFETLNSNVNPSDRLRYGGSAFSDYPDVRWADYLATSESKVALQRLLSTHSELLKRVVDQKPDYSQENVSALGHLVCRTIVLDQYLKAAAQADPSLQPALDLWFAWAVHHATTESSFGADLSIYYGQHFGYEKIPTEILGRSWQAFSKCKDCDGIAKLIEKLHQGQPQKFCAFYTTHLEQIAWSLDELASQRSKAEVQQAAMEIFGSNNARCDVWYAAILRKLMIDSETGMRAQAAIQRIADRLPSELSMKVRLSR